MAWLEQRLQFQCEQMIQSTRSRKLNSYRPFLQRSPHQCSLFVAASQSHRIRHLTARLDGDRLQPISPPAKEELSLPHSRQRPLQPRHEC